MATSDYIGLITCPLCGNDGATVHEQKTGTKKGRRYYRCYTEKLGAAMRCGTIQCIGPNGQHYINDHMRPIAADKPPSAMPEPIGQQDDSNTDFEPGEPIGQPAPQARSSGGLLAGLASFFHEDDEG